MKNKEIDKRFLIYGYQPEGKQKEDQSTVKPTNSIQTSSTGISKAQPPKGGNVAQKD